MKQSLVTLATAAAAAATPAPTHLGLGARARLDFGSNGDIQTEVYLRGDASRVGLTAGAPEPARPAHSVSVQIALTSTSGWLAGSPFADVRVRWAELGLNVSSTTRPELQLHGTAFYSPSLGIVDALHPQAQSLLGAVFHSVADLGATAGSAFTGLVTALTALGITTADPHGGFGISNDAWTALTTDAAGFLTPRLKTALTQSLAGFSASSDGTYAISLAAAPFQVYIRNDTAGIRTGAPFAFGGSGSLNVDAGLAISTLTPSFNLAFSFGAATLTYSAGRLTLAAPPWLDSLSLFPVPSAADLSSVFSRAVPRILLSSAAAALIEGALGPTFSVGAIDAFLESPGKSLLSSSALGDGSFLDASKITSLLQLIAAAAGSPAGPGLALPGNLQLTATGGDPLQLQLSTTAPLGGVVDLQLAALIDHALHVTPAGALTLHVAPLGKWQSLSVAFGVNASGVTLTVAPQATPPDPAIAPIQLLPTFSGLGSLAGAAAQALLPAALDALVDAIGPSVLRDDALAVAQAFDLYDAAGKFTAHSAQLAALTEGNWSSTVSAAMQSTAIPAIRNLFSSLTPSVTAAGNTVTIGAGGQVSVTLGWDSGPTVALHTAALKAADGAIVADIDLGYVAGNITAGATLGLQLQSSVGVSVVPSLAISYNGTNFSAAILPLRRSQRLCSIDCHCAQPRDSNQCRPRC